MSSQHDGSSHAWLFSFIDLAFLLLMVMSQLADPNAGPPLGEILVPKIDAPDARPVRTAARASWQLRVHPTSDGLPAFELSQPDAEPLGRVTVSEMRSYLREGHFGSGSMGPKVDAACRFVEQGGRHAAITKLDQIIGAVDGTTGTVVVPD